MPLLVFLPLCVMTLLERTPWALLEPGKVPARPIERVL